MFIHYDLIIYAARNSSSARRLATNLGSRRWRDDLPTRYNRRRPYFRGNPSPLVINWGSSIHPHWLEDSRLGIKPIVLNHGDNVKKAINKLAFFQAISKTDARSHLLKWTTDLSVAKRWLGKGFRVVCRQSVTGSGGDGIHLASIETELMEAPLYTRYFPKTHEFRVHIFDGKVIDLTQKKLRGGVGTRDMHDTFIRSLDNGWIHAHNEINLTEPDREQMAFACGLCISNLNLNFGAIDVLAKLATPDLEGNRKLEKFVICEVNTGPGLENTQTIEAYSNAILSAKENLSGAIKHA